MSFNANYAFKKSREKYRVQKNHLKKIKLHKDKDLIRLELAHCAYNTLGIY